MSDNLGEGTDSATYGAPILYWNVSIREHQMVDAHEVPTLASVAAAAGVSRQTVSNALNNPALLKPDTLAKVLSVIEEVGYAPNRAARQLRTRASHLIGLRFDPQQETVSSGVMDRFLHSLVETSAETGHHVLLFSGDPSDPLDGYDECLRTAGVDAFVVTDTYAGTPQAGLLRQRGVPFVTFGRPWESSDSDHAWVDVDGAAGVEAATRHLVDQGHRQVAWLGWEFESRIGQDRRSGWSAAAPPGSPATRITDNVDAARMAAHELLEDPAVTAFACVSDTVALGVLHACAERGLRPGADIGVTGFDDSPAAQAVWPGLTSVRQPLEHVAVALVQVLQTVLSQEPYEAQGRMLTPQLVVRRSSQREAWNDR